MRCRNLPNRGASPRLLSPIDARTRQKVRRYFVGPRKKIDAAVAVIIPGNRRDFQDQVRSRVGPRGSVPSGVPGMLVLIPKQATFWSAATCRRFLSDRKT